MDYGNIIKRAWEITWRYKILWMFGFFAGAMNYGSSGGSGNYSTGSGDFDSGSLPPEVVDTFERAGWWLQDNLVLIFSLMALFVLIGIIWWIISIAARGALIHLVNRAQEDGQVRAGDGWSVGFKNWGRLFLIGFLLWFPFFIVAMILVVLMVVPIVMTAVGEANPAAVLTGIAGTCGVMVIAFAVLSIAGVVLGLIATMAERHAVIGNLSATASIKQGWHDLRTRFGEMFLMWLIVVGLGIGIGILFGIVAFFIVIGVVIALVTTGPCGAGLVALALMLLLMVPGAVLSAFMSAIWTLYWRRMTGRDLPVRRPVAPPVVPASPDADGTTGGPGPPPAPPAPALPAGRTPHSKGCLITRD